MYGLWNKNKSVCALFELKLNILKIVNYITIQKYIFTLMNFMFDFRYRKFFKFTYDFFTIVFLN